jgi:hypothetical protein
VTPPQGALRHAVLIRGTQAAHVGVSWESISDWDTFTQFVQQELMRRVVDVENHELLLGDGTTGHLTGLLRREWSFDVRRQYRRPPDRRARGLNCVAVHWIIAGPKPDLFVTHPWTWSSIRRVKDTMGRYLVAADPSQDEVD